MKRICLSIVFLALAVARLHAGGQGRVVELTLKEAIRLAQAQSVDAAVALNELKTSYWEYRTYKADQLPEVNFTANLPAYSNTYSLYQKEEGGYTYVRSNTLGLDGEISVDQNIALTGGTVSLNTSLDFTRQLGSNVYNEYMSIPVGVTLTQPVFGVNNHKWKRRIEPVRYKEAKAQYMESVEKVTISAISYFFNLLYYKENLAISNQNLENANKLYEIAIAKRKIGHISESELMQLQLSALQAKGLVTEAQSRLNSSMFQIVAFLGLNEDDVVEPVLPEILASSRMNYREVLDKAQENNSFAKNILRRQLEADYEVAKAKGNRRSINLRASVGYTGKDAALDLAYRHLKGNQIVEVGVSIPLLDWGKRKGQVKVAESNREVILSRTRQEQMEFNQDIFLLVENFNNQAGQLEIAQQADAIAGRRYETAIETFLIGKINILDLNDAQNSKDNAKLKYINEMLMFWSYYYRIRSITLYDFANNRDLEADFEEIVKN